MQLNYYNIQKIYGFYSKDDHDYTFEEYYNKFSDDKNSTLAISFEPFTETLLD